MSVQCNVAYNIGHNITSLFPAYSWVLEKRAGWLVSRVRCLSACLSALGLAISPERAIRSTSFLVCGRGPPGPRMCARPCRRACEARQCRVYNAIRVDSVPSCKLGPARTRPQVACPSVRPVSVRQSTTAKIVSSVLDRPSPNLEHSFPLRSQRKYFGLSLKWAWSG